MRCLVAVLVLLAFAGATARAQTPQTPQQPPTSGDARELAEARRLEASLAYEPALVIVERLIARGGATRDQLVERHLLAGRLAAGLERADLAKTHFARVLALAPTTQLPDGTSPKLTEPFDAARALAPPIVIEARAGVAADLLVQSDPLEIVEGIAVTLADGRMLRDPHAKTIKIPRGTYAVAVAALDDYGNIVWSGPVERMVDSDGGPPRPAPVVPLYRRWTVWGGVSVFALAVGGLAAWRFNVAQRDWDDLEAAGTDYTQLHDVEDRGRRWGLVANVGLGVAAFTGIAAVICIVTRSSEPDAAARVSLSATPTSATFGWRATF